MLTACSSPVTTEIPKLVPANEIRFAMSDCVMVCPDDLPKEVSSSVRRALSGMFTAVPGEAASWIVAVFDASLFPCAFVARIWK